MYQETERRFAGEGRRSNDRDFCAVHHLLQDEKKESRDLVCSKIRSLKLDFEDDIKRMDSDLRETEKKIDRLDLKIDDFKNLIVGKYWFRFVIGLIGIAIVYVGYQQHWAFNKILANQTDFSIQLNIVENNQIVIKEKVKNLEEIIPKIKGDKSYGD